MRDDPRHNGIKPSISLRIDRSDRERVRSIAKRLRARESDVYRFAISVGLAKLAPLDDNTVRGAGLMPVFVECGHEIVSHFKLDRARLEDVINGDVGDGEERVDPEDIQLFAASPMQKRYLHMRLRELTRKPVEPSSVIDALRQYLHEKYVLDSYGGRGWDPNGG